MVSLPRKGRDGEMAGLYAAPSAKDTPGRRGGFREASLRPLLQLRQQLAKFFVRAQCLQVGVLLQRLRIAEAVGDGLPQRRQRLVLDTQLGGQLGDSEMRL